VAEGKVTVLALATSGVALAGYATAETTIGATPTAISLPAWRTDLAAVDVVVTASAAGDVFTAVRIDAGETPWYGRGGAPPRFAFERPAGFGESLVVQAFVYTATGAGSAEAASVATRVAPIPTAAAIDIDAERLPRLSDLAIDATNATRPVVTWQHERDPADADAAVAQLRWEDDAEVWTLIAPATLTQSIAIPALPEALALWRPASGPSAATAALIDRDAWASYADVRSRPEALFESMPRVGEARVRTSARMVEP
jgi:hypothetical protein